MTKRFQCVLLDMLPDRKPWERLTDEQLATVAEALVENDVCDIVGVLDTLSAEKDNVEAWDLAALLGHLSTRYRDVIIAHLASVAPETRAYLKLALR